MSIPPFLQQLQSRLLLPLLSIMMTLLVMFSAWQLAQLIWHSAYPNSRILLSQQQAERWAVLAMAPSTTPKALKPEALFTAEARPAPKPKVEAPKTALNLVLKAVFVAPDPQNSGAIIAQLSGASRYYKVGDTIDKLVATLYEVTENYVVLSRNGQLETLEFKPNAKTADKAQIETVIKAPTPQKSDNSPIAKTSSTVLNSLPDTGLAADIKRLNPKAFMNKYQTKFEENPNALLQEAGVTVAAGGRGYQVGQSQYSSLLESAGLKVNDVILSVNGQSLGDPAQDASLLKTLSSQKEVEVMIQRGERQFMVSFPISR